MEIFYWTCLTFQIILCFLICVRLFPPVQLRWNYLLQKVMTTIEYPVEKYKEASLSVLSTRILRNCPRKTLVLDMDETLITSMSTRDWCRSTLQSHPCDYKITLKEYRSIYFIFKRPHVDYFLETVNKWYNIVIYTAADKLYANNVLDRLDNGRGILCNRLFRKHCIPVNGMRAKFVGIVDGNLGDVFIIDNSNVCCGFNPENSIHIYSYRRWRLHHRDVSLLKLLPFLDALRFVSDVRSILSRNRSYKQFNKNIWGF